MILHFYVLEIGFIKGVVVKSNNTLFSGK